MFRASSQHAFTVDDADGDLNGDGIVDMTDALKVLRIAAGLDTPTASDIAHGDAAPLAGGQRHPDGKIDLADVVAILRKAGAAAKLVTQYFLTGSRQGQYVIPM